MTAVRMGRRLPSGRVVGKGEHKGSTETLICHIGLPMEIGIWVHIGIDGCVQGTVYPVCRTVSFTGSEIENRREELVPRGRRGVFLSTRVTWWVFAEGLAAKRVRRIGAVTPSQVLPVLRCRSSAGTEPIVGSAEF